MTIMGGGCVRQPVAGESWAQAPAPSRGDRRALDHRVPAIGAPSSGDMPRQAPAESPQQRDDRRAPRIPGWPTLGLAAALMTQAPETVLGTPDPGVQKHRALPEAPIGA